jgi:hypothetical protein
VSEVTPELSLEDLLKTLPVEQKKLLAVFAFSNTPMPEAIIASTGLDDKTVVELLPTLHEKGILTKFKKERNDLGHVNWVEDPSGDRYGVVESVSQKIYKHFTGKDKPKFSFLNR